MVKIGVCMFIANEKKPRRNKRMNDWAGDESGEKPKKKFQMRMVFDVLSSAVFDWLHCLCVRDKHIKNEKHIIVWF